jgi:hypothetical protein
MCSFPSGLKTNTGPTIQYQIIVSIIFLSCQSEKVGIKSDIRLIVLLDIRKKRDVKSTKIQK